jgi:hypothetical protein
MTPMGMHQIKWRIQAVQAEIVECEETLDRIPDLRRELAELEKQLDWYTRPRVVQDDIAAHFITDEPGVTT